MQQVCKKFRTKWIVYHVYTIYDNKEIKLIFLQSFQINTPNYNIKTLYLFTTSCLIVFLFIFLTELYHSVHTRARANRTQRSFFQTLIEPISRDSLSIHFSFYLHLSSLSFSLTHSLWFSLKVDQIDFRRNGRLWYRCICNNGVFKWYIFRKYST